MEILKRFSRPRNELKLLATAIGSQIMSTVFSLLIEPSGDHWLAIFGGAMTGLITVGLITYVISDGVIQEFKHAKAKKSGIKNN